MISISSKEMRMHDKTSNWFDTGKTTVLDYGQTNFDYFLPIKDVLFGSGRHLNYASC